MFRQQTFAPSYPAGLWKTPAALVAGLVLLVVFAIAIRAPFFDVPMISDEGGYAYVAHFWTSEYQLYRDIPFDRPQGIFFVYELIFWLAGSDVESLRMAAAVYNAGTALVLLLLVRQVFDAATAWTSALLFAVISVSPSIEGFTANAELFASLPLTAAALMTWRRQWAWAGLLSGVAFLIKPIGLSGVIFAVGWALVVRASWRSVLRAVLGFSLGPLFMLVHGYLIGWHYFWHAVVERKLVTDTVVSRDLVGQVAQLAGSLANTSPAWLLAAVLAALTYKRWPARTRAFVWLWVISSALGMAIGGHWSRHYYVQLVPVLSLMAGPGAGQLLRSARRLLSHRAVLVAVILFVAIDLPLWFRTPEAVSEQVYDRPGYVLNEQVAAYVSDHTAEDDTIYVAFYQAEIYYLAKRRNAVPQMYGYELTASRDVYKHIVASIAQREPAMVVWVQPPPLEYATPEEFEAVLLHGYEEVQQFSEGDPATGEVHVVRVYARISRRLSPVPLPGAGPRRFFGLILQPTS
ncbi:MAG: hypothetical protein OZ934_05380 [Anaerolineae bacterium]|nr:hypothetical protein [Anaerolineae bacterium]